MGACYVLAKINPERRRFAADINTDLVNLFLALQQGWRPPAEVPFELWKESKAAYKSGQRSPDLTFIGFAGSFAGTWYTNYARAERGNNNSTVPMHAARSLVNRFESGRLSDVTFMAQPYQKSGLMIRPGSVVYLDPPYEGTAKQRGKSDATINYLEFWRWARALVTDLDCKVYVSTFAIPAGWKAAVDITAQVNFASNSDGYLQHEYLVRPKRPNEA